MHSWSLPVATAQIPITTGEIVLGAEQFELYLPLLEGKRVAVVGNQTTQIKGTHLVDTLLQLNVNVVKVFSPEHGFRGNADAGEKVKDGKDPATGLTVTSLYGNHKKPTPDDLKDVDVVVFDIQDVGTRFYTYISTMHYVMEAVAENEKTLIVLDRPNPNGFYVDGPILEEEHSSFIGMHPIPVVHGLTIGELANMINGEGWLKEGLQCPLTVIPCLNYTHQSRYSLPVAPSPNLPNMNAIYLYPSLCFFEGTVVSVGRGTAMPFQIYGHPAIEDRYFSFIPKSGPGAKKPKLEGEICHGINLGVYAITMAKYYGGININWIVKTYNASPDKANFFKSNGYIHLLAGTDDFKKQIIAGATAEEIKATWQDGISAFKLQREPYLLYPE